MLRIVMSLPTQALRTIYVGEAFRPRFEYASQPINGRGNHSPMVMQTIITHILCSLIPKLNNFISIYHLHSVEIISTKAALSDRIP